MRLVDRVHLINSKKSIIPARVSAETGFYELRKHPRRVAFQSSIERGFVQLCDFANEVLNIAWEPLTISYHDLVDQKVRTYTPDYSVEIETRTGDHFRYIVEVKEASEAQRIWQHGAKSVAARAHVAMMAWCRKQPSCSFLLATDLTIEAKGLANIRAITDRASYVPRHGLLKLISSTQIGDYPASLGSLVANCDRFGFNRGEVVSTALRLCADDQLWFDVAEPWEDETVLYRGARRRIFKR